MADMDIIEDKDSIGDMETINENEVVILDGAIDDAIEGNCAECLQCFEYAECIKNKNIGCVG